jgi:hypothetical protein
MSAKQQKQGKVNAEQNVLRYVMIGVRLNPERQIFGIFRLCDAVAIARQYTTRTAVTQRANEPQKASSGKGFPRRDGKFSVNHLHLSQPNLPLTQPAGVFTNQPPLANLINVMAYCHRPIAHSAFFEFFLAETRGSGLSNFHLD